MRRREAVNLREKLDQVQEKLPVRRPFDKMSLHFVIPLVLFYLVIGILLIWLEDMVPTVTSWVLAAFLILLGLWLLLRYFRADTEKRIAGIDLAASSILLLAGILLACSPKYLVSVLPAIWGLSLIFGGFLKIQYAFDEKSVGVNRWWIMLIFSAVSLVIGILTLLRATIFGNSQLFIGIFMLSEALLDVVVYFLITHGMKKQNNASGTVQVSPQVPVSESSPAKDAGIPAE